MKRIFAAVLALCLCAAGAAMARSKRKPAKRMACKVAKGAEKAVMQMDRMLRQF